MRINKRSSVPLYAQLKELILEKIESGEYKPEEKIPTEMSFCSELSLSRPTVRQAIAELVVDGKLYIVKGRGTFVSSESEKIHIKKFSPYTFSLVTCVDIKPKHFIEYKHLNLPPKEIEKRLKGSHIDLSDGLYEVVWSESLADETFVFCKSYIPAIYYPNLLTDLKNRHAIAEINLSKSAVLPADTSCTLHLRPVTSLEMRYFDTSKGSLVLEADSELRNRNGQLLELSIVALRADICTISLETPGRR